MFFSKWTLFQAATLFCMMLIVFIAEFFSDEISTAFTSGTFASSLLVISFIVLGSSLISLFLIFHSKKSDQFLSHPLWNKMPILIIIFFTLSFIIFMIAFFAFSLETFILVNRWFLYVLAYYFLFLLNIFVLSIIHKIKKELSKERKIELSFIFTVLGLILLIFFIPSI